MDTNLNNTLRVPLTVHKPMNSTFLQHSINTRKLVTVILKQSTLIVTIKSMNLFYIIKKPTKCTNYITIKQITKHIYTIYSLSFCDTGVPAMWICNLNFNILRLLTSMTEVWAKSA
jgi:hypothetical protein